MYRSYTFDFSNIHRKRKIQGKQFKYNQFNSELQEKILSAGKAAHVQDKYIYESFNDLKSIASLDSSGLLNILCNEIMNENYTKKYNLTELIIIADIITNNLT